MTFYRLLLHLYPASFRNEYAGELTAEFQRNSRQARGVGALWLWVATLFEVLFNAVAVHFDLLKQDLRYTVRTLRRSPGFAATVVGVTALGIGANTAVLTVADQLMLRPLPFFESDRLVKLYERLPGYSEMELSPMNYVDWHKMSKSFEAMGAYCGLSVNLVGQGEPERVEGARLTHELLPLLHVQPLIGHRFTSEDDQPNSGNTVLLSYGLWQRSFGGDATVLGRRILLDGKPHTVIGVMPKDFYFPSRESQLWVPLRFAPNDLEDRTNNFIYGVARLKPGVTVDQAHAEMNVIASQLERAYPKENEHTSAVVIPLGHFLSDWSRLMLWALIGAAGCVLVIACTNIASLLLARAMARQRELAVRSSLGAGRERLIRQLVTESLVLALAGGLFGLVVAQAALPFLVGLVPPALPIAEPHIDLRVILGALLITTLTGLAFGIIPSIQASGRADNANLREGSRSGVGGRKERMRSMLVVAQVALSVVLLVSTGLLVRALWKLQGTSPGFDAHNTLTLRTALSMPKYEGTAPREEFYRRVLTTVRSMPGVEQAAYTSFLPIVMQGGIWPVKIAGQEENATRARAASLRFVTPHYFETMHIPLLQGRDVSESDTRDRELVAVVSRSFAETYWPGQNPLGRTFEFGFAPRTVVGVVGDVRTRGLERRAEPQVYLSYQQVNDGWLVWYAPKDLVLRITVPPSQLIPALREAVRQADPQQPVSDIRTLDQILEEDMGIRRVQARVLGAFAVVAFLLAGIGLHGLLSFAVSHRVQEFGVRMALGAKANDILGMVMKEGVGLAGIGLVAGLVVALGAGKLMESLLLGVAPADALTFTAVIVLALSMTLAGSLAPALRAVRIDPTTALRGD